MRGSDIAELRAFAAIVEEGNFARAAARLRISPSSLSQTIRELEARLGVRLLNRTTRSVSMTDAGQRLLARLKPALLEIEEAVRDVESLRDKPTGTVRLHVPRNATPLVEPLLGPFAEAYPDVVLDIMVDDAVTDIVAAGYDAGIRLGELLEDDMVAVCLGDEMRMLALASPDYVGRHGRPRTPADLHKHRCINWRWPGRTIYNWEFYEKGQWVKVAVNGPLIVNDSSLAVSAALQGAGIVYWTEHTMRPLIEAGRLVPLLEKYAHPFPGWYLTYPKQRTMPAAVRAFVDFLKRGAAPARKGRRPALEKV